MSLNILRSVKKSFSNAVPALDHLLESRINISVAHSGLRVAHVDFGSNISSFGVFVAAGSRHESLRRYLGASNMLRFMSNQPNSQCTSFKLRRQLEQFGASLNVTSNRDGLLYTITCNRNQSKHCFDFLNGIISSPKFHEYDFHLYKKLMSNNCHLSLQNSRLEVLDKLHSVAFRRGLGNTLFNSDDVIDSMKIENVREFHSKFFQANRMCLAAIDVDEDIFQANAEAFSAVSIGDPLVSAKSVFYGGQLFRDYISQSTTVALGFPGAPLGTKAGVNYSILARVIGAAPSVVHARSSSPISTVLSDTQSQAFHYNYSDAGLFGVIFESKPSDTASSVKKVLEVLDNSSSLTKEHLANAKESYLLSLMSQGRDDQFLHLSTHSYQDTELSNHEEFKKHLESVTLADIQSLCQKLAKGKMALSAVGDCSFVPYADEL